MNKPKKKAVKKHVKNTPGPAQHKQDNRPAPKRDIARGPAPVSGRSAGGNGRLGNKRPGGAKPVPPPKVTQVPPVKVPVASPRPESLGMESTSSGPIHVGVVSKSKERRFAAQVPLITDHKEYASKAEARRAEALRRLSEPTSLPPAKGPLSAFGRRQVMWFHHPDNYHVMGVCWAEHENQAAPERTKPAPQVVRVVRCYHILHRGPSGGIVHHRARPQEQPHLSPIAATTTLEQFEEYLRECLRKFGGPRDCWDLLGLEAPKAEPTEPSDEAAKDTQEELYQRAAKFLETSVDTLKAKYGHLNQGLISMNLRNRIRAKGGNV